LAAVSTLQASVVQNIIPDAAVPLVLGGYGSLLAPGALFPVFRGQVSCDGFKVAGGRRITVPCDYTPRSTFCSSPERAAL
jgi:hypothetical protein